MEVEIKAVFDPHLNIKHEPEEIIIDVNDVPGPPDENEAQTALNLRKNYRKKSDGMYDLFSCDHCEKTYLTKSRLKQHVQQNHFNSAFKKQPSKKFFCKLCHKKVLFLKFHLNTFHSNRTFDCDLCSFSTKYSANLKIHKDSIHSSEVIYNCSFCKKIFNNQSNRNRHVRELHRQNSFKIKHECHVCSNVSFSRSDNLKLHLRRIHGVVDFSTEILPTLTQCDFCPAVYKLSSKSSLIAHLKSHLIKSKLDFQCKVCSKEFKLKESLLDHLNGFHLKKFRCPKCLKSLGSDKSLTKHVAKCT